MAKQTLHTAPAFPKALRKWEGLDVLKHAPDAWPKPSSLEPLFQWAFHSKHWFPRGLSR